MQTLTLLGALFLFGTGLALWRCVRGRMTSQCLYPELLGGLAVSYLGMTYLTHKDPRYTLPALVYVAVLGTSWIVTLARVRLRKSLSIAVVVLSAAYFVGMSFGIGRAVRVALPGASTSIIYPGQLTLYETFGWVRGGPVTDGHVLRLLQGLRRAGYTRLVVSATADEFDFNANGLAAMAASLDMPVAAGPGSVLILLHTPRPGDPVPCQILNDGRGIYVVAGDRAGLSARTLDDPARPRKRYDLFCPAQA